jgi:hypothetical protein
LAFFLYPNVKKNLNRYLPLIKWLLATPHFLILLVLWMVAVLLSPIVWLLILIIGRMPKKLFNFLVGLMQYNLRVSAYNSFGFGGTNACLVFEKFKK